MQWLARPVATRLDRLVAGLHRDGIPARKSDVVGALVLDRPGTSAADLWSLVRPFKVKFAPPHKRRALGSIPVTLRLPSPISLRIDGLVELTRAQAVVYRHDLIGTLIMAAPESPRALVTVCERYWGSQAADAALPGMAKKQVLRKETPDPGPRRRRGRQTGP
jgi:hypothetical protein